MAESPAASAPETNAADTACDGLDDLDNLIADSLGGVQSALESERRAAPAADASASTSTKSASDAVRELQKGPSDLGPPNDEVFAGLVKSFQDENFQKAMADVLRGAEPADASSAATETSAAAAEPGVEDFLQNFLKSFEGAVDTDGNFEKSITSLMTSMLSNDLICEPLQQIVEHLEPWLRDKKDLPAAERSRYEAQLNMYRKIISVYKDNTDPLPEPAREEVQRLLSDLHALGQPPDEVMKQIAPKDAAEDGGESFEDFMKSMGLDQGLGGAEQDLLKKLAEDPDELTKVMKDMADGLPDEGCKQQ